MQFTCISLMFHPQHGLRAVVRDITLNSQGLRANTKIAKLFPTDSKLQLPYFVRKEQYVLSWCV